MPARISVLSTEYVRYGITSYLNGAPYNPTSDPVWFAFTAPGVDPTVWLVGSWETLTYPTVYVARCLIGPAGTWVSSKGIWDVWIKVQDSPEAPVKPVDTITIF